MNAQTQVAERKASPAMEFRDQIQKMNGDLTSALPPHIPAERFVRVVLTAVNGNPDLLKADRRSLFEAAMKAAQDGLLPDGRDGAFVVFKNKVKNDRNQDEWIQKVQWMPMVGGILKKVRNSGELLTISAYVAYENDVFSYVLGDDERIEHRPAVGKDRGRPLLVYAIAKTKDGGIYREVMTIADIEKVRNVSRAKDSGPWRDWWDEMSKKTVIRRLAKRLPMSSDLDDLIRRDDELYDFNGKRADAPERTFTAVPNPLADEVPPKVIEHSPQPNEGGAATEQTSMSTDTPLDAGSADKPLAADPVELTVEYGQALEQAKNDKDMDAVVMAFRPNYDAAKPHVRKIMDGLLKKQRERIANG